MSDPQNAGFLSNPDSAHLRRLDIFGFRSPGDVRGPTSPSAIWAAYLEIEERREAIDLRTVQAVLEERRQFERVGGVAYLAGLDLDLPDLGRVRTYAGIVAERARRRRLLESCFEIAAATTTETSTEALIDRAERRLIGEREGEAEVVGVGEACFDTVGILEERSEASWLQGLRTGLEGWDAMTQGLLPGQSVVVAGRTSMGKTALALSIARQVAVVDRRRVLYVSAEMSAEEISTRLLSMESRLPFAQVRTGRLTKGQWVRLYDAAKRVEGAPMEIVAGGRFRLSRIRSLARVRARRELALLVVDYLQLLDGGGGHATRQLEVAALSKGLKLLALELAVPVLVLSQLNREPDRRGSDRRPRLSDLRESGAIEQDADLVVFVHRPEHYEPGDSDLRGKAELIVAKHRNGEVGTVELCFDGPTMTFWSRSSG